MEQRDSIRSGQLKKCSSSACGSAGLGGATPFALWVILVLDSTIECAILGLGLDELKYFWFCSGAAKEQIASEAGERRSVCVCVCVHGLTRGYEP